MANPFDVATLEGPAGLQALKDLWDRATGVYPLVDGPTITVPLDEPERVYSVTLGGDRILAFSGGSADLDGKQVLLRVWQPEFGGPYTLTLDAGSGKFGTDITSLTLSAANGKHDYIGGVFCADSGLVDIGAGPTKGY